MKRPHRKQGSKKPKKQLTRKETRKEQRKQKKQRKNQYHMNRHKMRKFGLNQNQGVSDGNQNKITKPEVIKVKTETQNSTRSLVESVRQTELKHKKRLENETKRHRIKQLEEDILKDDMVIKKIEKDLKKKSKSKNILKSFASDGLDYALEVLCSETKQSACEAEQHFADLNKGFEEDFLLMTGKHNQEDDQSGAESSEEAADIEEEDVEYLSDAEEQDSDGYSEDDLDDDDSEIESENMKEDETEIQESIPNGRETITSSSNQQHKNPEKDTKKIQKGDADDEGVDDFDDYSDDISDDDASDEGRMETENSDSDAIEIQDTKNRGKKRTKSSNDNDEDDGIWEDIYGRKRRKDGTIIEEKKEQKYIPPAIRAKNVSSDPKHSEKINRLKKQLKGLFNRLAESNMHNISSQIETLYMNNSRFDMNNTIMDLILEALVSPVNTPERLIMEHVLLIIVLHANVGTEVGAHFLQAIVKKFDTYIKEQHLVENKTLDNTIKILAQLYNFKLYDSKLLYDILDVLSQNFEEKEIECILHILRSVGFSLRKDDPVALKDLILKLRNRAADLSEEARSNSRVKFMLDILLAIKNNNKMKIPNYDPSYSEHLKKILKNFIRKGNYVTPLSISLEDLLKAEENGKWWIIGSAWTGKTVDKKSSTKNETGETFSQKILELAKKHRMNTDTRRNIFCVIMSAEDHLHAYQSLLKLGLKGQQEREIINVIIHGALQEHPYNPYYAVLTQKFCDYDRKYQMMVKYCVWDKLKAFNEHSADQISNLAKLLTHLFINKSLSISALKIIQFNEVDTIMVRFMRQILLGIFLHDNNEEIVAVFEKVGLSDKLKMFRMSLQLFIGHFLLKNLKQDSSNDQQKKLIQARAKIVMKILLSRS